MKLMTKFFQERAKFFNCSIEEAIEGFKNDYKKCVIDIDYDIGKKEYFLIEDYNHKYLSFDEYQDIMDAFYSDDKSNIEIVNK